MSRAAIIGGGVIGGGWAARFVLAGWDVAVFDPDPEAPRRLEEVLANARRSYPGLADSPPVPEGRLSLHASLAEAVTGADWIQESVPERLDLKRKVYQAIQADCPERAIIASSTSGFRPSQLQGCATRPEQIVVAHPFNPVYLLPLVELVGSDRTPAHVIDRARDVLTGLGMHPLHLKAEIDAHVADRLLEAVWREALWLVRDGIATTGQIDDAIRLGFGLRWAQMGLFETYRIAGGTAGMRHFLAQFGPALAWPWSRLTDVPDLDADLIETIAAQSDAQAQGRSIAELERIRDDNLVAMLRALKAKGWGAGEVLRVADTRRGHPSEPFDPRTGEARGLDAPILTLDRIVPSDWTDYNGHMNEARYLEAFGDAGTRLMEIIGCDRAYIAAGASYFTAETHIRHLDEARAGARITVDTQVLRAEGAKLHIFQRMHEGDRLIATGEHFMLHVSLQTRRPAAPPPLLAGRLAQIARAHAHLPPPEGAGRAVGQPR